MKFVRIGKTHYVLPNAMPAKKKKPAAFTKKEAFQSVQDIPFLTLAFSSLDQKPYSAALLFVIDKKWNVYFATDPYTRKHELLTQNNHVGASGFNVGKAYVQMTGAVSRVTSTKESERIMNALAEKAVRIKDFWPPLLAMSHGSYVIYCFTPDWIRVLPLTKLPIHVKTPVALTIRS